MNLWLRSLPEHAASPHPEVPFLYKDTLLPMYDSNLIQISGKIRSECVIAHVRGEDYYGGSAPQVGRANLHPFQYEGAGLAMAHNGGLARFGEMKYHLLPHVRDDVAAKIEGTTDSEWLYALLLSRFEGPAAEAGPDELARAVADTLRIVRAVRDEHDIHVASGVNLFVSNGKTLVVTRFSFDFGCYEGRVNERQLVYHSLWFTAGQAYGLYDGEWRMGGAWTRPTPSSSPPSRSPTTRPRGSRCPSTPCSPRRAPTAGSPSPPDTWTYDAPCA